MIPKKELLKSNEINPYQEGILGKIARQITGISEQTINSGNDAFQQLYSYVAVYTAFGVLAILVGIVALSV